MARPRRARHARRRSPLTTAAGAAATAALAALSLRRAVLLVGALLPRRALGPGAGPMPSVTLVVPARNEGAEIDGVLAALERLDYPPERLELILVDDGSKDDTGVRMLDWARGRDRVEVMRLESGVGKYEAVNRAVDAAPRTDVVALCDGDLRPRPTFLRELVAAFADPAVAGAVGYVAPINASEGPVARYAAVETWVYQLVTSAGRDRFDLNPLLLGASVMRREAVEPLGWFAGDGPGQDVLLTRTLTRAGWRTRFVPDAVAEDRMVSGWRTYWHQHIRWARNSFAEIGRRDAAAGRAGMARSLELWMQTAGYADRLVVLAAAGMVGAGVLSPWAPATYLMLRALEVPVAVVKAGEARQLPLFLLSAAAFFAVDVAASTAATVAHLRRAPRGWPHPRAS